MAAAASAATAAAASAATAAAASAATATAASTELTAEVLLVEGARVGVFGPVDPRAPHGSVGDLKQWYCREYKWDPNFAFVYRIHPAIKEDAENLSNVTDLAALAPKCP